MFTTLKVLNSVSGKFFDMDDVLIGDCCDINYDSEKLTMESINADYESESKKMLKIFEQDPSIIDRMSEMAAEDYLELFE